MKLKNSRNSIRLYKIAPAYLILIFLEVMRGCCPWFHNFDSLDTLVEKYVRLPNTIQPPKILNIIKSHHHVMFRKLFKYKLNSVEILLSILRYSKLSLFFKNKKEVNYK